MRVVVNLLAAAGRKTGIGHYATQLVRCLREQAVSDQIATYLPPAICRFRSIRDWLFAKMGESRTATFGIGQAAVRWHFRTLFTTRNCDLYHEPNFIPLPTDLPTVATIHDLSALLQPEWHPAQRVAHFERNFRTGLKRCEHFLTDSDYTRHEVIQMLHLPPERVTRVYIGVRPGLRPMPAEETAAALREMGLPPR
jgi:hypothetical protein